MLNRIEEFHTVEGVSLEVVRLRPEEYSSNPPIVMLHEGLGSVAMWKDFPERLAASTATEVIAYSRAGYGRSGPAKLPRTVRYMHDEGLKVLPRLIDLLEMEKPILFGHSDGGSIALICAGGTETALSGLVIMAPHIFVEQITVDSIAQAKEVWQTTDLPDRLGRFHDDAEAAFIGWNDIWLHSDFFHWNIEEYLSAIQVPVLAIQGHDEYGSMVQIDGIARVIPNTLLLKLPNCRHSPHKDQPEAVLAACNQFIDSQMVCK